MSMGARYDFCSHDSGYTTLCAIMTRKLAIFGGKVFHLAEVAYIWGTSSPINIVN